MFNGGGLILIQTKQRQIERQFQPKKKITEKQKQKQQRIISDTHTRPIQIEEITINADTSTTDDNIDEMRLQIQIDQPYNNQLLKYVSMSEIDRQLESDSLNLIRNITQLKETTILIRELLYQQQPHIDQIEMSLDTTDIGVQEANNQLVIANESASKSSTLSGLLLGVISGVSAGGAISLCTGVGALPCIIVGGVGGTVLGIGSTSALKNYIDKSLRKIQRHNTSLIEEQSQSCTVRYGDSRTLVDQSTDSLRNDSLFVENNKNEQSHEASTPYEQNLLKALQVIIQTGQINRDNYNQLLLQSESFRRSVRTIETIQQELVTSGVLIARLQTNTIIYFLRMSLTSNTKEHYIEKIAAKINNKLKEKKTTHILDKIPIINKANLGIQKTSNRRRLLLFWTWKDVMLDNNFLLLQKMKRDYRIVALDPENEDDMVALYAFQSDTEQDAISLFNKIKTMFLKMFYQMDTKNIYNILSNIDSIDGLIKECDAETTSDQLIKEMSFILSHEIMPYVHAIQDELSSQNTILDIIDKEVEETRITVKRINKSL